MNQPASLPSRFSPVDKIKIIFVGLYLVALLVILGYLLGLLLRHDGVQVALPASPAQATPAAALDLPRSFAPRAPATVLASGESPVEIELQAANLTVLGLGLRIEVSIDNVGDTPVLLSASDISLAQSDATPLAFQGSEPSLPVELRPGETKTLALFFERPDTDRATLKIFTAKYKITGF